MYHHDPADEAGHGLANDLATITLLERRRALALLAGAGLASLVAGCGDGAGGSGSSASSSSSSSSSSTSSSSSSTSSSASTSCVANASETNGPYPADGTNTSSGATSNVLTQSGIVRSDIRSSFISSTATVSGVLLTLTLRVVDSANNCAPIVGAAVYIWHCSGAGLYSLYSSGATTESWLRGVQVTDSNGEVTFTTIYPGCYTGRWPHIHMEVYKGGLTSASTGKTASLISQLAMPDAINSLVYATGNYSASVTPYASASLSSDNVFNDNTSAEMAQMTPTLTGNVSSGYTGTVIVGL